MEQDVTLDALNELDSSVMNNASRRGVLNDINTQAASLMQQIQQLNDLKSMIGNDQSTPEQRRDAETRIPSLEESIQSEYDKMKDTWTTANSMGSELEWNIDLDLDEDRISTDGFRDLIVESHMGEKRVLMLYPTSGRWLKTSTVTWMLNFQT